MRSALPKDRDRQVQPRRDAAAVGAQEVVVAVAVAVHTGSAAHSSRSHLARWPRRRMDLEGTVLSSHHLEGRAEAVAGHSSVACYTVLDSSGIGLESVAFEGAETVLGMGRERQAGGNCTAGGNTGGLAR